MIIIKYGHLFLLLLSVIVVVASFFSRNYFIGYRTATALASDSNWKLANRSSAILFFASAIIMYFITKEASATTRIVTMVCMLVGNIVITELLLKTRGTSNKSE